MPDNAPLSLSLWALSIAFNERLSRELASLGITSAEFRLIGEVLQCPDGIRQSELARRLSVSAPTVSAAVARMERSGLLVRRPDLKDPRAKLVSVAPRAPLAEGAVVLSRIEADLAAGLSDEEHTTLGDSMTRLAQALAGTPGDL